MLRAIGEQFVNSIKMNLFKIAAGFASIAIAYIIAINILYISIPPASEEFDFSVAVIKTNSIKDMKYSVHYCTPHDPYRTYHNIMRPPDAEISMHNMSAAETYTYVRGDEGLTYKHGSDKFLLDYFQLEHVGVTIRHGDRHNIHVMPIPQYFLGHHRETLTLENDNKSNNSKYRKLSFADDEVSSQWYDPRAFQYKSHLKKFSVHLVDDLSGRNSSVGSIGEESSILHTLSEYRLFNRIEKGVRKGVLASVGIGSNVFAYDVDNAQLTTRGFMQHVSLGKHLSAAYGLHFPYLFKYSERGANKYEIPEGVNINDRIYVRSTKYDRTVQSASALLLGLLGTFNTDGNIDDITIEVIDDDDLEVMHGVGWRTNALHTMLQSIGDGGGAIAGVENKEVVLKSLLPWKVVPELSERGVPINISDDTSVAYDNGCQLGYSLALQQQYRHLGNNNKTGSLINKQCHETVDYRKSCDQSDLVFIKHKLSKILHDSFQKTASVHNANDGVEAMKAIENSKKQLMSMAATEIVDSVLVPLCHHEDGDQLEDGLLRPNGELASLESTGDLLCKGREFSPNTAHTGKCIDETFMLGMKQHADSVYCNRYYESGDGASGRRATNLAIYPFLKDILYHITSNTRESSYCKEIFSLFGPKSEGETIDYSRNYEKTNRYTNTIYNTGIHYGQMLCNRSYYSNTSKQNADETPLNGKISSFSLFSGHDTVILPVLTALGVFKPIGKHSDVHKKANLRGKHKSLDEMHCEWPPYASRIVFEVYNPKSLVPDDSNKKLSKDKNAKQYMQNFPFFLPFEVDNDSNSRGRLVVKQQQELEMSMANGSISSLLQLYGTASASYLYEPYVRILYNGKVITPYVDACKAYHRMVVQNKIKQSEIMRMNNERKASTQATLVSFIESNRIMNNRYHNGALLSTDICPLSVYETHLESLLADDDGGGDQPSDNRGPFYKNKYKYVSKHYQSRCNTIN